MTHSIIRFCGCRINLNLGEFVPGGQTAWWVERVARKINAGGVPVRVLDIFSGSGCIGVALLAKCPRTISRLDFSEKYKNLCMGIGGNCMLNSISQNKYTIIQSDLFEKINGKYDYICACPPYAAKSKIHLYKKSVIESQPSSSMFGGKNGLLFISKFLKLAPNYLNNGGKIFMEFDPIQQSEVELLIKKYRYKRNIFHKGLFGRPEWVEIYK